jgi:inosose dehydratase
LNNSLHPKIGVSPSSWGIWFADDPLQMPWQRVLDETALAGYKWIELGPLGFFPSDSIRLVRELDRRGLKLASGFARGALGVPARRQALLDQVRMVGTLLAGARAQYLILLDEPYQDLRTGAQTGPARLSPEEWHTFVETIHAVTDLAKAEFGLRILFEAHTASHVEYQDQIEQLLADTDPARVSLLLDLGHFALRNGDPVPFLRKHINRIPYLHLKSVDSMVLDKVAATSIPFSEAVRMGIFVEPALGDLDYDSIRDTLRAVGFDGWAIVEQGMYPAPFDKPLPIAKRTRDYLRDKGWG